MKKKYLIVSLLIFISVLSCNFLEDAANNAGLTGNTTLDLPISYNLSSVSRTLATDYGITVSSIIVTVENDLFTYGPDVLTFDADTDIASGTIEDIVEGTYTVTLSAYMLDNDSNPVLVAEGVQTDVSIVSDQTTNVDISMSIVVGLGDLVVNGEIVSNEIPRDGLVAEYLFDGNANDTSGNGNDGTVNGATLIPDRNGIVDSAYSYANSSSTYIQVDNNIGIVSELSVSVWININQIHITYGSDFIIDDKVNDAIGCFGLRLSANGIQATLVDQDNNGYQLSSNITPSTGEWINIVLTHQSGSQKLYVNNELVNNSSETFTLKSLSNQFFIGKAYSRMYYFDGYIDDLRIYNRVLADSEIATLNNL